MSLFIGMRRVADAVLEIIDENVINSLGCTCKTDYSTTHGGKKKIEQKEKRMNEWAPLFGIVGHFMNGYQWWLAIGRQKIRIFL